MSDFGAGYGSLLNDGYLPRIIEGRIAEGLEDFGAVCIEGAKYCGKTWVGQAFANSEMNLMDPAGGFQNREIALLDPSTALQGDSPRLIDEWQEAPQLWDGVRNAVDRSGKRDSFILTGSSIPRSKADGSEPMHTGVGRIEKLRMRPMSLAESGDSTGEVSLAALFEGTVPSAKAPELGLSDLLELACRGGWPATVGRPSTRAQRVARSYVREICEQDMSRVDGIGRDPEKVSRLLHSLARNMEQATKNKTVIGDMTETATEKSLSPETVTDYLHALSRIFVLEEIGSWSPNIRSGARINKRPKYHFVDPSIPVAILKTSAKALMRDLNLFGFVFECMCVRDILVYAQAIEAEVYYYRDSAGLEVDVVVEAADGSWAGMEVKLGHSKVEEGTKNLKALRRKVVEGGGEEPAFLAVIEGLGSYAYAREDGVYVLPLATLTA
ncbi:MULTISPECIES: ATP-binding protein [unclassified Adlercreutzia]|uniref:ATP-binding protein n=1 Tax=unclassified Adlercreutzia TaxID=2636013 RepID=UPI0013ECC0C7|nr:MULTISPECIES: DUF4143 domain-containing protein [unclassified Adlercreutzia]